MLRVESFPITSMPLLPQPGPEPFRHRGAGGGHQPVVGERFQRDAGQPVATAVNEAQGVGFSSEERGAPRKCGSQKIKHRAGIVAAVCDRRKPLLGHCWAIAGPLLGHCWAIAGPVLGHCWAIAGPLLGRPAALESLRNAKVVFWCSAKLDTLAPDALEAHIHAQLDHAGRPHDTLASPEANIDLTSAM